MYNYVFKYCAESNPEPESRTRFMESNPESESRTRFTLFYLGIVMYMKYYVFLIMLL